MSSRCPRCGSGNIIGYMGEWECMDCGYKFKSSTSSSDYRFSRPTEWKNPGITAVLALVFGFFILMGIGHIYIGRIRRGIMIMVAGLILIPLGFLALASAGIVGLITVIIFWLILLIWQTYDAYKLAKEFNRIVQETGREPW
jgi:TM2 domain-containing membrane protein YozV/DNA-directed RNA polymerase subunit RPC12/RpoP